MQAFKKRLYFNLAYFGLWLGYFALARFIFLAYYSDRTEEISWETLARIPLQGMKLDLSFTAYLSALPFLLIAFSIWLPQVFTKKAIKTITFPLLFVINFLMMFDLALYGPWGVRLDSTPLMYLNTPKEMFASVTTGQLLLGISIWIALSVLSVYVFNKVISASFCGLK